MLFDNKFKFLLGVLPTLFAIGMIFSTKDRIPFNDGLGYDGNIYAEMIKTFPDNLVEGHLNPYYTARIAPIALCATTLDCLSIDRTNNNILLFFRFANSLLFLLLHYYWHKVGKSLHFSDTSYWMGYLTLLLYYCGPRTLTYYPILTDGFAIVFGMALVHYVIRRNLFGIISTTVLGMLTWPICHLLGMAAILSLALKPPTPKASFTTNPTPFFKFLTITIFFVTIVILTLFIYAGPSPEARIRNLRVGTLRSIIAHIPLLALIAAGLFTLLRNCFQQKLSSYLSGNYVFYLVLSLALYCLRSAFIAFFADESLPQPKGFEVYGPFGIYGHGSPVYQFLIGQGVDGKVFLPLICHFLSFGPIILYTILNWQSIVKVASHLGFFFLTSLSIFLLLSLSWESRYNQMSFPALVVIAAVVNTKSEQENLINFNMIKWYAFFLIYCSRIWTSLNPIGADISTEAFVSIAHENFLSLSGRGMNWNDYFFFGATMLLALATYPSLNPTKNPKPVS
jgi:hypothetical protein